MKEEEEEGEGEEVELLLDRESEQAIAYQWVKQLHLVPMRHSRDYSPLAPPTQTEDASPMSLSEDIDHIISHLQVRQLE